MQFKTIQQTFFFSLLLAISVIFLWMIKDFIFTLFWAVVLGMLFYPLHQKVKDKMPRFPQIASVITITILMGTLAIGTYFIGTIVVKESVNYYQSFVGESKTVEGINIIDRLSIVTDYLATYDIHISQEKIESTTLSAIQFSTNWIKNQIINFGQQSFKLFINLFILVYIVFYILNNGSSLLDRILHIIPLGQSREKKLIQRFVSTTRATLKGTFLIALIQGALGGCIFWIAGVNAPFLWGIVMMLLSIIPAVGPGIVWLPTSIILLLSGNVWQGLVVLIGGIFINLSENILRPTLVGKDAEMPGFLIMLATFGGISVFGITGFIIGPIITAFLIAIWHMFEEDNRQQLTDQG